MNANVRLFVLINPNNRRVQLLVKKIERLLTIPKIGQIASLLLILRWP